MKIQINWQQAAGEGLILLIGIILALAGQAWWESRVREETISEHITNLLSELDANTAGTEHIIKRHDSNVAIGTELLRLMANDNSNVEADSVHTLVSPLTLFSDFRPATAAFDSLVGAGDLRIFEDPSLHLAISTYGRAIADHNVLQTELAEFQINHFMAFLENKIPLLGTDYADRISEPRPTSRFVFEPSSLFGSMQFENLVLRRVRAEGDAAVMARRLRGSIAELRVSLEDQR